MRKQTPQQKKRKLELVCEKLWREAVKKRADGKCELCGKQGTDAHHMVSRRASTYLKFRPENGMFLCKGCHIEFHNKDSYPCWRFMETFRAEDFYLIRTYRGAIERKTLSYLERVHEELSSA